jgi:transposase
MKGFYLTEQELIELRAAHKEAKRRGTSSSAYKINAIILLGTGWTFTQVKEALLLDEDTLNRYVERYKQGGISYLIETQYTGRECLLTIEEVETLKKELDSKIYLTTTAIIHYVADEFEVTYSISGMCDLLHRIGYEYKKPKIVPGNPDIEAQEIFVEQYEQFMLNKRADVEVLFIDAVHPEHNAMAAYGWIRRGERRKLKTNSGRERLNLHGAINAETHEITVIESETIDAYSTLNLLNAIEQRYPGASEIVAILDNAQYHYSKLVKEYLSKGSRVRLVFLPSYSPNLNLIERVWKFFKKQVLYNTYYPDIGKFREACIQFFRNFDQFNLEISRLMSGEFELT